MTKSVKAALEVNVNDFVCFERIGGDYEWNTVLARVISIPTAQHVRVELFDRADAVPVGFAPYDNKLGQLAEQRECEDALNELAALRQQHQQLVEEEDRASESLYRAREVTQGRQAIAASMTRQKMVMLDQMRIALEQVPARSWRDLRCPGRPSEELFALGRALMIALQEDYNGSWESLQNVMRQPDFMSRLMELDCTVTPFSSIQRKKIKNELPLCPPAILKQVKKKKGGFNAALFDGAPLVVVLQEWLRVQVACSEAREAEERVVDSCFAELQQQSLLLTEVNGLREMISMIEEQIIEKKQALVGSEPVELLTNEEEPVSVEGCFVQRVSNGRTVKDIIPRDSVLHVFGPKESKALSEEEGSAICVQLQPEELAMMQQAVRAANDVHDVDELEALFAAEERGEQEKRDLLQRMEELGKKDVFTEDDEEEMRQLDTFLTDVTRRHERTIWRRRCLQKAGRDKLYLEKRYKIENTLYSEMHVYFTGEKWQELLDNEEHCERLREAFQQDTSAALSMPQEMFTNLTFEGYPLKASFTTEHDRSNPKEALQAVLDRCTYPTVCAYYHSVTDETAVSMGEKAKELWLLLKRREHLSKVNFTGSGLVETLEEFDDEDYGFIDDEDYRKPCVEIAEVRCDYDLVVRYGYPLLKYNETVDASYEDSCCGEQPPVVKDSAAVKKDTDDEAAAQPVDKAVAEESDDMSSNEPAPHVTAPTAAEPPVAVKKEHELNTDEEEEEGEELSEKDADAEKPDAEEPVEQNEELSSEDQPEL